MAADTDDTATDTSELAREVIAELDPGTIVEDKIIISRRMAILVATGTVSAGALLGYGSGTASADVVGQVGTSADRVDVFAGDVDLNTIDGNNVVSSGEGTDYRIEKNGTDGSGVINLKTQ
jgi:hypothetical protein